MTEFQSVYKKHLLIHKFWIIFQLQLFCQNYLFNYLCTHKIDIFLKQFEITAR